MAKLKTAKILAWGDPHCPFQDRKHVEFLLRVLREERNKLTHVVCLGDVFEGHAASRWPNEYQHDLVDEYASAAELLFMVDRIVPNATKVWLLGNHDYNLQKEGRLEKSVRRACHWLHSEHREVFMKWRHIPYGLGKAFCYEMGQVIFKHGVSGIEDLEACRFVNACGGFSHRLVVGGHTHRPLVVTRDHRTKKVPNNVYYCNAGTLGPLNPTWTHNMDTSEWAAACILVECKLGRACQSAINWEANLIRP